MSAEAIGQPTPYSRVAVHYLEAGWSPIPLPHHEKWPPPDGFTGADGAYVNKQQVIAWSATRPRRARAGKLSYPPSNVAIRLPGNVIGLDVDAYAGKQGSAAMAEAEKRWGPLPDTWMTSSKTDGSGIRLYRVPEGLAWPGDFRRATGHGGVELIRPDHRYAIVFPSIHDKTGDQYGWWFGPGGLPEAGEWRPAENDEEGWEFPDPDQLPELPERWIKGLTGGNARSESVAGEQLSPDEVRAWIKGLVGADGAMCSVMRKTLSGTLQGIRIAGDDGGAHEAARDGAWACLGDGASGHSGIVKALSRIRGAFFKAVEGRRDDRIARGEWERIVNRGVAKVAAEGAPEKEDICTLLGDAQEDGGSGSRSAGSGDGGSGGVRAGSDGDAERSGVHDSGDGGAGGTADGGVVASGKEEGKGVASGKTRGSSAFDYERDDIGNAQRLAVAHRHVMRYLPSLPSCAVCTPTTKRWVYDNDGQVDRWCIQVVRGMEQEAKFIEDPKQQADFLRFVRGCGMLGKLRAMGSLAASLKGMSIPEETFDADPYLLACANGVVDLRGKGLPRVVGDGPTRPSASVDDWEGVRLRPAVQEQYITKSTGIKYDPKASSRLWDGFLNNVQPDPEAREWLQRLVGYSLMGGNPERLFIVAYGPTSTGKSTFVEILNNVFGGYGATFNLSMLRASQDERPRADIVDALDRRFIYAEEPSEEWHLHPDQIKRITGGTPIVARRPFARSNVERVPAFTPWMAANAAPSINGADAALKRRIVIVPFDAQVEQGRENVWLKEAILREAAPAVLAWALRGWESYVRVGGLHEAPTSTWAARQQFASEMSEMEQMLSDVCEVGKDHYEMPSRIYRAYLMWCERNDVRERDQVSQNKFGRWMTSQGYRHAMKKMASGPRKVRTGLRLKDNWAAVIGSDAD